MRSLYIALSALLIAPAQPTLAIVIRHDVPAHQYLASANDFPPLATFYRDGAHGSLIAPRWVVTAGHTVFCLQPRVEIDVGGTQVKVKKVYVHHQYQNLAGHDLALIELDSPVTHVTPVSLYGGQDEKGKAIWFIGTGGTGTGDVGQSLEDGVLRKAQNTIASVTPTTLRFVFESGEKALPLEGVSGAGDSGGPAYLAHGKQKQLLGISSGFEGGNTIGAYGITEIYTRISAFIPWIEAIMADKDNAREQQSTEQMRRLLPGLTKDNLTDVCNDIRL